MIPIPSTYKNVVFIGAILAASITAFSIGSSLKNSQWQNKWDKSVITNLERVAKVREEQSKISKDIDYKNTKEIIRLRVIRDKLLKEVQNNVTKTADAKCAIPIGFVRQHDAAADNALPNATNESVNASSGVALSTVSGIVTENYATYYEVAQRLLMLQEWVKAQSEVR